MSDETTPEIWGMWRDGSLVGQKVRAEGRERVVVGLYDVPGGVRLDRNAGGFVSWNVDELELAEVDNV